MSVILWNTSALAQALANREITPPQKFNYLLISYCMYAAAGYFAWLFVIPSNGWLFWYEGLLVLIVTYFGLLRCRDSYAGAADDRLLEHSVILGVPLGLKLIVFTWSAHAFCGWAIPWIASNLTITSESPIEVISFLLTAAQRFYAFIIAAVGTGLFFSRLSVHLHTIAQGSSSTDNSRNE